MDHSENTLRAVIKSLTDAVAPAIDPADPLANEQLRLCVDYLEFLQLRLDDLHGRSRFEAEHAVRVAQSLSSTASVVDTGLAALLTTAVAATQEALGDPAIRPSQLAGRTEQVLAVVREIVRASAGADPDVRAQIEAAVLAGSEERVDFDRSWYQPYGFDPLPGTIKNLDSLLYR